MYWNKLFVNYYTTSDNKTETDLAWTCWCRRSVFFFSFKQHRRVNIIIANVYRFAYWCLWCVFYNNTRAFYILNRYCTYDTIWVQKSLDLPKISHLFDLFNNNNKCFIAAHIIRDVLAWKSSDRARFFVFSKSFLFAFYRWRYFYSKKMYLAKSFTGNTNALSDRIEALCAFV